MGKALFVMGASTARTEGEAMFAVVLGMAIPGQAYMAALPVGIISGGAYFQSQILAREASSGDPDDVIGFASWGGP